ncbi:integrase, catalytic region, zinc finger, CCHC-type containing protein [Tanacetum coccineum]
MQGTSLTKQEKECKLYDAFDKFTRVKGESLHKYYLRFTQLINDMNIYNMKMEQFQVNTKFLNSLPLEWSKFVTDVKLVKDLHTTNFDQLHAYLEQHELHVNEVRLLHKRNQDPLAFVANQQMTPPHFNTYQSLYNNPQLQQQFPPSQYGSIHPNQQYSSTYPSQPQFNHSSVQPSYPYHFVIPVFSLGDDLIACLNKVVAFLTAVASSRVIVQQVQGRQGQSYSGTGYKSNATSYGRNNTSGQARVVKCYNCQGEGHMARQCTQPKRPRNAAWYKDKAMLAEAQEAGQILDEEQLAFLADPGVPDGQAVQTIIPNNAAFQTEDLDTYDSDCDDISNAKAVLMANISNYGSDVISEVPHSETYLNDMENQETQQANVQDTNLQAQQDSMILFVIEQMSEQMINHVNNWEKANKEQNNESVTAELERYKEQVKTVEQHLNINLSSREKMIDSQMDDMIKEKLALKEQVNSLDQNISKQIKEKELGQSAQTVYMKDQRIKPTLYDGIVISNKHVAMPVIDDEETLILEEKSQSKILSEDFGKCFTPQQELDAEQAFWFCISNPTIKSFNPTPVKVEVPSELPMVSLVNAILKKLKFHLAQFDSMVKKRTTPDACTKGEWGFEHTKAVFNNEIILFLKSLKDIFNVFDKYLLNEIMEVHAVFDQMDDAI